MTPISSVLGRGLLGSRLFVFSRMVCWLTTSTDAGISCAVRPSRLALPATTLLLSGVGAGSVFGRGTGFAGLRAARLARFGAPCGSPA